LAAEPMNTSPRHGLLCQIWSILVKRFHTSVRMENRWKNWAARITPSTSLSHRKWYR